MSSRWYVRLEGKEYGPHSVEQLRQLAAAGRIPVTAEVKQDNGPWVTATDVKGLTAEATHRRDSASISGDETLRVATPISPSRPAPAAPRGAFPAAVPRAVPTPAPASPPPLPKSQPASAATGERMADKPVRRKSSSTAVAMVITLVLLTVSAAVVLVLALATTSNTSTDSQTTRDRNNTEFVDSNGAAVKDVTAVDKWRDVSKLKAVSKGPVRIELLQYYLATTDNIEDAIDDLNQHEAAEDESLFLIVELGLSLNDEDRPTKFRGWNRGRDSDSTASLRIRDEAGNDAGSPATPTAGSSEPTTTSLNKTIFMERLVFPVATSEFSALRVALPYQTMQFVGAMGLEFPRSRFVVEPPDPELPSNEPEQPSDGAEEPSDGAEDDSEGQEGTSETGGASDGEPDVDIKNLIDNSDEEASPHPPAKETPSEPTRDIKDIIDGTASPAVEPVGELEQDGILSGE
jgi:hypothetical protein